MFSKRVRVFEGKGANMCVHESPNVGVFERETSE